MNLTGVYQSLRNTDPYFVLIGIGFAGAVVFVRTLRWTIIQRTMGIIEPLTATLFFQLVAQVAFITPGKLGDFLKAFYLKKRGHSLTIGGVSIVVDRALDVLTVLVVSVLGLFSIYRITGTYRYWWYASIPTVTILLLLVGYVYRIQLFERGKAFFSAFIPDRFVNESALNRLEHYFGDLTLSWVGYFLFLSVAVFFIQVLQINFFCYALGISIPYLSLAGIIALMLLTNLIPISFSGLGTREAVFLYFFGLHDVKPELIIGLSLLLLFFNLAKSGLGAILFTLNPPPFDWNDLQSEESNSS